MDIPDIIPIDFLSEILGIPAIIILPIIFLLGYITIRCSEKQGIIPTIDRTLDEIFLIAILGFIWFIRIGLFVFVTNNFLTLIDSASKNQNGILPAPLIYPISSWSIFIILLLIFSLFEILRIAQKEFQFQKGEWFRKFYIGFMIGIITGAVTGSFLEQPVDVFYLIASSTALLISYAPSINLTVMLYKKYLYSKRK